jgi:hypothetical protein
MEEIVVPDLEFSSTNCFSSATSFRKIPTAESKSKRFRGNLLTVVQYNKIPSNKNPLEIIAQTTKRDVGKKEFKYSVFLSSKAIVVSFQIPKSPKSLE